MQKQLDHYQEEGATWLAKSQRRVLYLADQMRVGKTPQVVVAVGRLAARRTLVVCPAIVRGGWLAEFENFCTDRALVGNAVRIYSRDDAAQITESTRLVIVSYDLVSRPDVFSALYSWAMVYSIDVLVLDEAHYLKEKEAKRTRAILGNRCTGAGALAEFAKRTWWLSGTPMPNDPSELFPFMRQAGLWPKSKAELIRKFCFGHHDGYEFKITGAKDLPELKKLLAPVTLRRLRTDISQKATVRVGSVTIEPREINPAKPVLARLAMQEPRYAKTIQDAIDAGRLDKIAVIRTPAGHPSANVVSTTRRLIGWAKVAGTAELLAAALDAEPGLKIAVFGIHRDPLLLLRNELRRYGPYLLYGGMAAKVRERMVQWFGLNPHRRLFIANMSAAGIGIDLSIADQVWIFEPSWTPADNAQAISRIINVREPRPKEAFFVGLSGSIDDAVTRVYERKAKDIEALYSAV